NRRVRGRISDAALGTAGGWPQSDGPARPGSGERDRRRPVLPHAESASGRQLCREVLTSASDFRYNPLMNRRQFVFRSAAVTQLSSSLLKAASRTAARAATIRGANDRLRLGVIGCGGMANSHMDALLRMRDSDNVEIAAVCDVYKLRLDAAAQKTSGKPVSDHRAILDDKDIDYVLIATPEHWHYQMTMDAIDAGKHIYCEKPMTHTIAEAKRVVEKVHRSAIKMQVGVQGMSDDSYETAYKYVQDGTLGKVVIAQIDYSRNHVGDFWTRPPDPDVRPGENLDWKAWLGPAPKRPYDPDRFFPWPPDW